MKGASELPAGVERRSGVAVRSTDFVRRHGLVKGYCDFSLKYLAPPATELVTANSPVVITGAFVTGDQISDGAKAPLH